MYRPDCEVHGRWPRNLPLKDQQQYLPFKEDMSSVKDRLKEELQLVNAELKNSKSYRDCLELLVDIHRNIQKYPDELKFRNVNCLNRRMQEVFQYSSVQRLFHTAGWQEQGTHLIFMNEDRLEDVLSILLDYRLVSPGELEWKMDNKIENIEINMTSAREEELKRKASLERDKELAECLRAKAERKRIAEDIKAEHRADKERNRDLRDTKGPSYRPPSASERNIQTFQEYKKSLHVNQGG